jgi:hypothetical protein
MITIKKGRKMTNSQTWYGYTREEYYALIKQPNDPDWEQLCPEFNEVKEVLEWLEAAE